MAITSAPPTDATSADGRAERALWAAYRLVLSWPVRIEGQAAQQAARDVPANDETRRDDDRPTLPVDEAQA